jgi:hypothetical protein
MAEEVAMDWGLCPDRGDNNLLMNSGVETSWKSKEVEEMKWILGN